MQFSKGGERKKEKKELHRRQSYSPPSPHVAPLERRRCEDSNDTVERWLWPLEDIALTTRRPRAPPNTCQPLFQFNNILYLLKNQIASTNLIIIKKAKLKRLESPLMQAIKIIILKANELFYFAKDVKKLKAPRW
jgi:hypothetical protein